MARLFEVLPLRLVALVAAPLLLGLVLLVALVDLPPFAWALVYVGGGGMLVMVLIALHVYLLEYQDGLENGEGGTG